ncbi:hypothetical protein JG688_00015283 [Phytophthora aleatoria]|uniref:Uncharacterized protein n=1 Tax=Phytophthora aleatoria TaxID=2496075 RepID=A0A8J5LWZ0_9STRA|nr:hypothetical protein JG688_00015283 [Phytophthora aleatoria]
MGEGQERNCRRSNRKCCGSTGQGQRSVCCCTQCSVDQCVQARTEVRGRLLSINGSNCLSQLESVSASRNNCVVGYLSSICL